MADVYFLPKSEMNPEGFKRLVMPAGAVIPPKGTSIAAFKIHPGEDGNTTFIPARIVKQVVDAFDLPAGRAFLTDTTVL